MHRINDRDPLSKEGRIATEWRRLPVDVPSATESRAPGGEQWAAASYRSADPGKHDDTANGTALDFVQLTASRRACMLRATISRILGGAMQVLYPMGRGGILI